MSPHFSYSEKTLKRGLLTAFVSLAWFSSLMIGKEEYKTKRATFEKRHGSIKTGQVIETSVMILPKKQHRHRDEHTPNKPK